MIGFNELGAKGWLGNQMFQYASLVGIAENRGFQYTVPPNDDSRIHDYNLFNFFEMKNCKNIGYIDAPTFYGFTPEEINAHYPHSSAFEFNEKLFNECPDNMNINGFFQTEKYFKNIRNRILEDFKFKKDYDLPTDQYISLHVRRNDYLLSGPNFAQCSIEYYRQAIDSINVNLPVVVLSDDIAWCRENIPGDIFAEGNTNDHDLYIMSKARHNIIANSTYGWWGAWLNQNPDKIVVAPSVWFGPALIHHDTKDLYPPEWRVI